MRAILLVAILVTGCEHLDKIKVKGDVTGTKYDGNRAVGGKHIISATYPLSKTVNIKGRVAQPYDIDQKMDYGMPDYGETGIEILF